MTYDYGAQIMALPSPPLSVDCFDVRSTGGCGGSFAGVGTNPPRPGDESRLPFAPATELANLYRWKGRRGAVFPRRTTLFLGEPEVGFKKCPLNPHWYCNRQGLLEERKGHHWKLFPRVPRPNGRSCQEGDHPRRPSDHAVGTRDHQPA